MNITAGQQNNLRRSMLNNITKAGMNRDKYPQNNPSFGASLPIKFVKGADKIIHCDGADKFIGDLNKLFGSDYFSSKLDKINIKAKDNSFEILDRTFLKDDVLGTMKVLFVDAPMTIVESAAKIIGKGNAKFIQEWRNGIEKIEARNFVLDVIEEYSGKKYGQKVDEKLAEKFAESVTSNVAKVKKNYASRDERTLNRIVTSLVSAVFSYNDFYNISMMRKDDRNEAKRAGLGRFKQEIARLALNASCTFIGLGMFDRYTKRSLWANAAVIGISAACSEVISRLISKTPLKSLTPEEAKEIALARKAKNASANKENNKVQKDASKETVKNSSTNLALSTPFSAFVAKNGNVDALNVMKSQIAKENEIQKQTPEKAGQKGKLTFKQGLALAFAAGTVVHIVEQLIKGNYKAICKKNKLISENKDLLNKLNGNFNNMSESLKENFVKIQKDNDSTLKKVSIYKTTKKKLQQTKEEVDTKQLIEKLKKLQEKDSDKKIDGLITRYISYANQFDGKSFEGKRDKFLVSSIITGLTKIFETVYEVLTMPAKLAEWGVKKVSGANDNVKLFDNILNEVKPKGKERFEDELVALHMLLKGKDIEKLDKASADKIIDTIAKRARNVEIGSETGQLANTSRTMVTAIGTWFFVNDYKNSVLIESEGKDVEGAKEEVNTRIWHKASNFVINGTLMNLFNTTFKSIVNGSLLGAALVATATEICNESSIRFLLSQPIRPKKSRQELIECDEKSENRTGVMGAITRTMRKITGKKSLAEKAGIKKKPQNA